MKADACGPYELGPMLARGGMAEIFPATPGPGAPEGLPDDLVVKRLLPRHAGRPDFIRLFQREAEIVRQLDHPGIVRVVDVGQDGDVHYIVMERVQGQDLKTLMSAAAHRGEPTPFALAAFVVARVAEALDHAHQLSDGEGWPLGLVHRDICPHNILISWDGDVKLSDFGIARAADRAAGVRPGQLTGRVGYLSPEQVQGLEVDSRSDLFSLGVVLWEMVLGRRLFKAPSQIETMQQVQEAKIASPLEFRADCPEALADAMLKALSREVADRQDSAAHFARQLDAFVAEANEPADAGALAAYMAAMRPTDELEDATPTAPARPAIRDEASEDGAPDGPEDDEPEPPPEDEPSVAGPASGGDPEETPGADDEPEAGAADDDDAGPPAAEDRGSDASAEGEAPERDAADDPAAEGSSPESTAKATAKAKGTDPPATDASEGDVPPRPARPTRRRQTSRVHDIPSIGEDNPDDVYLALSVNKGSISGRLGMFALVAVALLAYAVHTFVDMGNAAQEKVFTDAKDTADKEREVLAEALRPVAKPTTDGRLSLRSDPPGASLLLDWQPVDRATPTEVPVFRGKAHVVHIEAPGYAAATHTLMMAKSGPLEHSVQLNPASDPERGGVAISTTPPGAEVFIGGASQGKTPLQIVGLAAGPPHAAVIRAAGHTPVVSLFTVSRGGLRALSHRMSPADVDGADKRDLQIRSIPDGATVHLDGQRVGSTPLFQRLSAGDRRRIVVSKAGYEAYSTWVAVGPAAISVTAELIALPPQYGYLSLSSAPSKATVYIGNNEVGKTPLAKYKLPTGKHTVVLDTPKRRGSLVLDVGPDEFLVKKVSWDAAGALVVH